MCPRRTKQLKAHPVAAPRGVRDKAIMSFLKYRAKQDGSGDFLERLHKDFWTGEGGSVFSTNCSHRFEDFFLKQQDQDFTALANVWRKSETRRIVEFGCNSGLLLNYLTTHLPGVEYAIGLEINAEQVRQNQQSESFDERVSFVCADAGDWLLENGTADTLYVSNGGVLEYFQRSRLDEMLSFIAQKLRPAIFFAVEPVATDHDWASSKDSIPFGEEISFSHNYQDLFQSNDFEIQHQRPVDFESWHMVATVANACSLP